MSNPTLPAWKRSGIAERAEGYKHVSLEAYARLLKLRLTLTQTGSPGVSNVQATEELDLLLQMMRQQLGTEADIHASGQRRR